MDIRLLLIKISAQEQRRIEKAESLVELQNVRQMVLDKLQVSATMREFGKAPSLRVDKYLPWSRAIKICREVIGEREVTMPPFPDNSWYARINGHLRREGHTEETVRALAEYARDYLRRPVSFDFLICQQHRIMTGEFDVAPPKKDVVPEMPLLPED